MAAYASVKLAVVQEVSALDARARGRRRLRGRVLVAWSQNAPTRFEWALAGASALLLVLSFPDFNLWPLAWVALVPLAFAVTRQRMHAATAFVLGWATGTVFFYATCWWLTHAMVHYGGIPRFVAFPLLFPAPLITGLFPALWTAVLARLAARRGTALALACAPALWAALEWARLAATGQLWNALGYSQAFHPALIQTASWGGVYAVGFLIVTVNAALAYFIVERTRRAAALASLSVAGVALVLTVTGIDAFRSPRAQLSEQPTAVVVAVQPNVSVDFSRTSEATEALVERHLQMSNEALRGVDVRAVRVVVWPESPMNFTYTRDARFRETVARFAREQRASVLFNSLEPAPAGGAYNSAVLINEEGLLVAQYDKIRLLPFGEYVPLPRWLPLTWLLGGVVGDFTPGAEYPLMPLGGADISDEASVRAGVFICFESAFPSIASTFAARGADVLINIANDGYLGRTPVIRQHLANVVLRAVETGRPVLRVTNTGVSARITPRGEIIDETRPFETSTRTWFVGQAKDEQTFYTRHGDLFAAFCVATSILALASTLRFKRARRSRIS
ncbi:MAG TPA: apolipoprotein N-acyltransferase [Pyrinomonadaceae bacterium]|nr:apolipoprotein N-acyltransferase [Pyrinomonadaceae bacterium]